MKRSVNKKKAVDFSRMKQKLMSLKRRIILPEMFKRSRGSRRIKARFCRPSQVRCEPSPHVRNVRQHRRERREPRERLRLRREKAKEQRRRRKLRLQDEEQTVIEEELRKRDPINESSIVLTPGQVRLN